jgi:predicted Zn-dependent protease
MGLFNREDKLTTNDLKNILLWYERMIANSDDATISDNRTMIKIQAMLIYQEESAEEEDKLRRKWRR